MKFRFDNTFRYSAGWRVQKPDSLITNTGLLSSSDMKFSKRGSMITNRGWLSFTFKTSF